MLPTPSTIPSVSSSPLEGFSPTCLPSSTETTETCLDSEEPGELGKIVDFINQTSMESKEKLDSENQSGNPQHNEKSKQNEIITKKPADDRDAEAAAAADFQATLNAQRAQRLHFLLERSSLYSKILSEKLNKARDAKAKDVKSPSKRSMSKRVVKRRNSFDDYDITEYIENDPVKKKGTPKKLLNSKKFLGDDVSSRQPSLITGGVLKEYQLAGVEWLVSLYENGLNGILADEMGLGKTIQTISFLAFLREKGVWGPFLIVVPVSTLANWIGEFKKFAPSIPVIMYHGSQEERENIRKRNFKKKPTAAFPIVVTSYEISMRDKRFLQKYQWKLIVVDEGHRLKNLNCKLIKTLKEFDSANRLLLTGTPLHNNLAELWSLLNFLLPDIFDDLDSFQSWFDVANLQDKESTERFMNNEQHNHIVSKLHQILQPFLLRRLKVDVEQDLPKKKEYMIYAPLTLQQKKLYDAIIKRDIRSYLVEKKMSEISNAKGMSLVNRMVKDQLGRGKRKKRIIDYNEGIFMTENIHQSSDDEFEDSDDEELFGISKTTENNNPLETPGSSSTSTARSPARSPAAASNTITTDTDIVNEEELQSVTQSYALKLATKSVNNMNLQNMLMQLRKVCNHPYLFDWPRDIKTGEEIVSEDLVLASGKMLLLNRLLEALFVRDHKVLVFSQFTTMLDIIEDWAVEFKNWKVCRIDGNVSQNDRQEEILEFNQDPSIKLFLLSTRAGGLGINLTAADTVILFDSDWNPQMDLQAQDRVHRIGQKKPVIVYRLVARNTVESTIIEKASAKRKLEKIVIASGKFKLPNGKSSHVTMSELAEILMREDSETWTVKENDEIISDTDLEKLLDRSDAVFTRTTEPAAAFKEIDTATDRANEALV